MSFRVALTDPDLHPPTDELTGDLARADARLDARVCGSEEELAEFCAGADAVLCARAMMTRKVISQLSTCRIIARVGTGYDNVDVEWAGRAGIPVTNVPDFCTPDVAEHTWMLILACARALVDLANETRRALWRPDRAFPSSRLSAKTIGLVGFGKIGQAVAERALAFGMRVAFFDPAYSRSTDPRFECRATLPELLSQADIVSLHLPLTEQTRGLIGREAFATMKRSAILINCARGAIVSESDLEQALREGRLAAAGLDTLSHEPPASDHPLLSLPNVIITPHCAAHTVEALTDVRQQAYAEVTRALRGEPLLHVVNRKHLQSRASPLAAVGA